MFGHVDETIVERDRLGPMRKRMGGRLSISEFHAAGGSAGPKVLVPDPHRALIYGGPPCSSCQSLHANRSRATASSPLLQRACMQHQHLLALGYISERALDIQDLLIAVAPTGHCAGKTSYGPPHHLPICGDWRAVRNRQCKSGDCGVVAGIPSEADAPPPNCFFNSACARTCTKTWSTRTRANANPASLAC